MATGEWNILDVVPDPQEVHQLPKLALSDFLFLDYVSASLSSATPISSTFLISSCLHHNQHTNPLCLTHTHSEKRWSAELVSLASHQGPGYHSAIISVGLITPILSHHFPRVSAPPHAPDTESYVTASLESHIAWGWWSESACFCLTEQQRVGRGFICVETSHFPPGCGHLS